MSRLTGDGFWGLAPGAVLIPGAPSRRPEEVDSTSSFHSILFDREDADTPADRLEPPEYFADLHLDDIVGSITTGREMYRLAPLFYAPLGDVDAITYRHEVFRDFEDHAILEAIRSFGHQMETVQREAGHAEKASHPIDQERWLLRAAEAFCAAVQQLNDQLRQAHVGSAGLSSFRDYLAAYAESEAFTTLIADTQRLKATLGRVSYRLRIHGSKVTVTRYRPEPDYSAEVLRTFEKFRQGAAQRYEWQFDQGSDMNHVEAAILDQVARLYPDVFAALHDYAKRHRAFLDPTIARFDREARFYLAYLGYLDPVRRSGLQFCYPQVAAESRSIDGRRVFDLALAASLVKEGQPVVPNDVELHGAERILVVSGPNQGGKTTFARAIGQLHHLARIGVPVPGERLQLPLVDLIFTHFERQEQVEDLSSKLENDLRRIHAILERATSTSVLIMNESFTSTTVGDQLFIGRRVMRQIIDCGLLCVMVTFLDELASLDPAIVSMVSRVDPDDHARRTFEIVRRPADGLAYALAIAEKHRLTYPSLKTRLSR
jgi:DNA mismatch repair protein MutS